VLRGRAGLWQVASGRESDVAIFVGARPRPSRDPLALTVSPYRINSGSPLAGVKTTAYVERLAALDEGRGRGFAEAVMLNERGEVAEATAANLFWVRRDELATPSLATGCLAGVMRRLVLEAASRLKIRVVEGSFPLSDLHDADELFLTNCGRGIVSAAELDIHRYEPAPGPVALRLATAVANLLDAGGGISRAPGSPSVE
jgi:branched-subunit amino acid aminotransferase/4-amino-4-deoxychorismate lyase